MTSYFQKRREYIPVGSGENVLFSTVLKTNLSCKTPLMRAVASLLISMLGVVNVHAELRVLIIEGLGGEAKYQQQFDSEVKAIRTASASLTSADHIQVLAGEMATRANITSAFDQLSGTLKKDDRLACYFIGHGSYDGYEYKFNIPGPDIGANELTKLLGAVHTDNQLIVATGSASGALQEALKKDTRVIITATRNGNERNATHFGSSFAEALNDAAADTDKNGRITAQEAFDLAARKVKDYFEAESRLATEHAQLVGSRAGAFSLAQLGATNTPASNGVASTIEVNPSLTAEREHLNSQLEELRLRKDRLGEDEYLKQLEPLMVKLAELDAKIATGNGSSKQ